MAAPINGLTAGGRRPSQRHAVAMAVTAQYCYSDATCGDALTEGQARRCVIGTADVTTPTATNIANHLQYETPI